jgi:hypothetical protein
VGGLVGESSWVFINNSYWDTETSGQDTSAGGVGLTTAEMQMANTFIGWGCEPGWTIDEGNDYPHLWWENKPGELITVPSDLYGGGTGEPKDPYLIYTAEQLNTIGLVPCHGDKHFLLMADIDLSGFTGKSSNIIGSYDYPFTGVFDGNNHTISKFSYTTKGTSFIGLFGYVAGENAEIKDLGLIAPNVDAGTGYFVGSLIGRSGGNITNCYVQDGSVAGERYVGGLVGENHGTITNCYSSGDVSSGDWYVGGLVGDNEFGTITNCYSTGSVSGVDHVGGLVGYNGWNGTITHCYTSADVSGVDRVGGLVGYNWHGTISNCYSTGIVLGTQRVGGLVGRNYEGQVTSSFWDIETSGQVSSDGGTGLPTAEMQTADNFFGWWCGSVWTIDEGKDYPHLWWEDMPGEPIPNAYGGGSGEPNDPYLIYTAGQLNTIGLIPCDLDKNFKLMADIDLSGFTGTSFNIIGTHWTSSFTGVFDGSDHTISNFTYNSTDKRYFGIFGCVDDPNAEIKDLGLINPNVDAGRYVGSLVGYMGDGTIVNCYANGGSVAGNDDVSGLVGYNYEGTITNSYATASVAGNERVGGLVGWNWYGTISNCYSTGSVSGVNYVGGLLGRNNGTISNSYSSIAVSGVYSVGGLVGYNRSSGTITNCYSIGTVSGGERVGGLVGWNRGTINNCYSNGSVTGDENVGGLVGVNGRGTITNCYSTGSVWGYVGAGGLVGKNTWCDWRGKCYEGEVWASFWDIETSGIYWSDGGEGKTTAEMQTESTFTDAGWDFVGETFNGIEDIWFIPQGDYPHLWWEGMQVPMKLTPRTLNCRSKGNWVKAHLTLPQGFTLAHVDPDRPAVLHSFGFQSAPLYVFVNDNELVQVEAAFEREALCSLAGDWPQKLTVAGFLTDGNIFLGTSTVRMITPGLKEIGELSLYWLNADCVHPDFCDRIDMNRDSLVNLLDYALLQNSQVEFVSE